MLLSLLFMGCSKSTVVLLKSGKSHNAVVVSTDRGSSKLDQVGNFVNLTNSKSAPSRVKQMSQKEIENRFAKVLAISPKAPISYMLYFEPNSTTLTQASEKTLEEAIKTMTKRTSCSVDIIGHTDTVGSKEQNMKVSLKRAAYIQSVIAQKKVKGVKLRSKGYGEADLLVKTADNVSEAKNRNVEIFIK